MKPLFRGIVVGTVIFLFLGLSGILNKPHLYEEMNTTVTRQSSGHGGDSSRKARSSRPDSPSHHLTFYYNSPLIYDRPRVGSDSEIGSALIELIDSADHRIDFALFGFKDQPEVLDAIVRAMNRGVNIRGVVDKDIHNEDYYDDTEQLVRMVKNIRTDYATDLLTKASRKSANHTSFWPAPEGFNGPPQAIGYSLKENKAIIAVHAGRNDVSFQGDIMHNKFFIVDGMKVWTGSTNISDTGTGGYNANIACIIENETVARYYTAEFNQMYEQGLFHRNKVSQDMEKVTLDNGTAVDVFFSPQDSVIHKAIRPLISNAAETIDISVYYLTDKYITADLIKAHHRGVSIRVIIDATSAQNGYTKHEILRAAGIPVKVENWGGKMHMKSMTVDNEYLVIGSMNFSAAGTKRNDENTLVVKSLFYANEATDFFNELWDSIPDDFLSTNPGPESYASVNSMRDGKDNDHDGLIDMRDDGHPNAPALPPYKIVPKEDGYDLIKGVKNNHGVSIYILPNDEFYNEYAVDDPDEHFFPSIQEAEEAGFEAFSDEKHMPPKPSP